MARQTNLTIRNGTFYLRVRVPTDLAASFGRTHVVISLRTKERRLALTRFRLEQARVEREFEAHRQQVKESDLLKRALAGGRLEKLASHEIESIVARWMEHAVQRVAPRDADASDRRFADWDGILEEVKAEGQLLTSPDPDDYGQVVTHVADQVLLAAGAPSEPSANSKIHLRVRRPKVDRSTPQYAQLATLVRRGLINLNAHHAAQLSGEPAVSPLLDFAGGARMSPTKSLDELLHAFVTDPGRGSRTGKTELDYRLVSQALRDVIGGETPVSRITREHARQVRQLFSSLPPNASKRFPGATLLQAAEIATRGALPTLNTQTVNSYLTKMATLFNWAVKEEWMDRSPAKGLMVEEVHTKRREPFSPTQLVSIFSAPIFTGCEDDEARYARSGPNHPRRARFWVPLLSLFHGLRLNECCQLRPQDVSERDGLSVILVRAAEADQRVKSKAGARTVPLHPTVKDLGFLEFVADARRQGAERLFPELPRDSRGYFSDAFQKWFVRFLKSCGAERVGTTFHSFRHGWADRLRDAGVPEDRRRALGGWADTGVDAGYGRGFSTKMLAADIALISYPSLEQPLAAIRGWTTCHASDV